MTVALLFLKLNFLVDVLNYIKLWVWLLVPTWIEMWFVRAVEYCLDMENMNLSAIRTIRVLRPLRAINRIPSKFLVVYLFVIVWHDNEKGNRFIDGVCVCFQHDFLGMRILVMLLLDTLPMLGNVLLLCFFVFFIFGIVGVQLWAGILRQRCYLDLPKGIHPPPTL